MPDLNALKHNDNHSPWQWYHRLGGVASMSNYYVFHIFSMIMDDPKVERIVEIGTAYGGMTVGLALEGVRRDIGVYSFDTEDMPTEETKRIFGALEVCYYNEDVFSKESCIECVITKHPCYLLCDGGDKPRELKTFAPLLQSGSYVSVHDWQTEVFEKDVEFMKEIADPFHPEDWLKHNVQLATWKIR